MHELIYDQDTHEEHGVNRERAIDTIHQNMHDSVEHACLDLIELPYPPMCHTYIIGGHTHTVCRSPPYWSGGSVYTTCEPHLLYLTESYR